MLLYLDDYIYLPYLHTFANNFIIFTPLFSYGTTCYGIYKKQTSEGFLIDICATMLIASVLRICYYIVQPFEFSLFLQSCVMIFIHCILLSTSLKYRPVNETNPDLYLKDYPSFEINYGNKWFSIENLYSTSSSSSTSSSRSRLLLLMGSGSSLRINQLNLIPMMNLNPIKESNSNTDLPKLETQEVNQNSFSWSKVFLFQSFLLLQDIPIQDRIIKNIIHGTNFIKVLVKQILYFFDGQYRRPFQFWQWAEPIKYWIFLFRFTCIFGILTLVFKNNPSFGHILGIMGLFIEALLPLPQILLLSRVQSVKNFKVILLLSWLGGDCTKISYLLFGTNNATPIFMFAALFQMSLDILIAYQYLTYRKLDDFEQSMV